IADLEAAEAHIHLLDNIIHGDQLGTEIAKILIKKAKAGVEVRVLYDDMGSPSLKKKYIKELEDAGVKVDAFFPPLIPKINFKIKFRKHRKHPIIDGNNGYRGGFNMGDEYFRKDQEFRYWRDAH